MAEVKLTKSELRDQQKRLSQLEKYLPTLQLKKALLQMEVSNAIVEMEEIGQSLLKAKNEVLDFAPFLMEKVEYNLSQYAEIAHVHKSYENVAGVEIPVFERIEFQPPQYFFFDTPVWTEAAMVVLRKMVEWRERLNISQEKKRALEKELREVSIRVNLFEKILIPRAIANIKKIKIFLGDLQLSAVAQAKVAKKKIEELKEAI
ncbi:MAG TPA: V-type ATP synthase subunit D [Chlamydiales bacterium]|nr:V-type ATP synthase subunit D [Chlamydiales bacterium]